MNASPSQFGIEWDESELLIRDLQLLLKRDGFVAHRVARATTLRQILGGADESYEIARERFISAIESLRDPYPQMLLEVFALTPDVENLTGLPARYEYYGARVGLKIDAVRKQVAGALDLLRNQLTTGWYPKSPLPFRVPESHNGLVNEVVLVQTVVRNTKWQETREHYRFVAAFDEAAYLAISTDQGGLVEAIGGFSVSRRQLGGHFEDRFSYKEPMHRGNAYDLRFRRLPEPDVPDLLQFVGEWRAFHEPTRIAIFEVVFLGRLPTRLWKFSGLTHLQAPGDPSPEQLLNVSAASVTRARFADLYGGLFSGVAWEW